MGGSLHDAKGGSAFPAIKPEDLDGDLVVVTIAKVEITDFGGGDVAAVATYEEVEGKKHRLNATSRKRLLEGLGTDQVDAMTGKKIALEVVSAPNPKDNGNIVKSVWVADVSEWPRDARRPRAATSSAKRSVAKARK